MSKYRISLEGKTYEMEIDLVSENAAQPPVAKQAYKEFRSAPKDANVNVVNPAAQKQKVSHTGSVAAPMPGTVLKIEKGEGQEVKAGDVVLILEAMKMENEITAPVNGKIAVMNCTEGGTVAGGEVLFEIK